MPPMRGSTRSCRVRTSRHPPANASKPSRLEFGHDVQLFCIVTVDSDSCARLPKQTSRARRPTRVARIRLARSTSGRDFVERFFRDGAVQVECSLKRAVAVDARLRKQTSRARRPTRVARIRLAAQVADASRDCFFETGLMPAKSKKSQAGSTSVNNGRALGMLLLPLSSLRRCERC